jgi:hypothetical protein
MSFTVQDIRAEAEEIVKQVIAEHDAIRLANACIAAMGGKAWRETTKSYPATVAKKWYNLPSDFIRSIMVKDTIGIPAGLTVTPQGATGSTSWGYRVSAVNENGETLACEEIQVANGNAALSATNYNALAWTAVTGATSYKVYRTTAGGTPSTTGVIGSPTTNSLNDTGLVGDGTSVPVEDMSGEEYDSYTVRDRRIRFDDADDYVLTYAAYPAKLTTMTGTTGTPDLPDIFLYPMANYMAGAVKGKGIPELMSELLSEMNNVYSEVELESEAFQVKGVW